jgi:hypothetical protein
MSAEQFACILREFRPFHKCPGNPPGKTGIPGANPRNGRRQMPAGNAEE